MEGSCQDGGNAEKLSSCPGKQLMLSRSDKEGMREKHVSGTERSETSSFRKVESFLSPPPIESSAD